jgi:hypothetical protein
MRLLSRVILELNSTINCLGYQFYIGDTIATQFIGYDLHWLTAMTAHGSLEETLCSSAIPLCLHEHIHDLTILIHCSPRVMLLAVDLYKDFINEEGIAISSVLPLQPSSVYSAEFDTPSSNCLSADSDASLGK